MLLLGGCGAATGAPDAVAQATAPELAALSPTPASAAAVDLPESGLNTCALDADDDPRPEPDHASDPNPRRPKPTRADPHYHDLVVAPKSRQLTEGERLQHSSPAYYMAHDIGQEADYYGDVRDAGYGDLRYDTGRDVVDLWWKGPIPAKIRRLIQAGPARHVQVKVHPANHGRGFLLEREMQLLQDAKVEAELAAAGIHLKPGGSLPLGAAGLDVPISCSGISTNPGAGAALVRKVVERRTGVQVITVIVVPESYGRVNPL